MCNQRDRPSRVTHPTPLHWSALPAARQGEAKYRTQAGFTKTGITVYPVGSPLAPGGHVMDDSTGTCVAAYDFAKIVTGDLNLAGIPRLR